MGRKRNLTVLLALAILAGCAEKTLGPDVDAPGTVALSPATVVLDAADRTAVLDLDAESGELVLDGTSDLAGRVQVGDLLAAGPASAAPDGFLRLIRAVRSDQDRLILETEAAPLTAAVLAGAWSGALRPSMSLTDSVWTAPGVSLASGVSAPAMLLDLAAFDGDGVAATTQDRLIVTGRVALSGGLDVGLAIDASELTAFRCVADQSQTLDLAVAAGAEVPTGSWRQALAAVFYKPAEILIGDLPVVLRPVLHLDLSVDAVDAAGMAVAYELQSTVKNGAAATAGVWERLSEAVHTAGDLEHAIPGPSSLTVTVLSRLVVEVYGDDALAVSHAGRVRAAGVEQEELGRITLAGSLAYELDAEVTCAMERLGSGVADHADDWRALESQLWSDGRPLGDRPATPFRPYPADGATDVPPTANLSWDGDPAGDGRTYDLHLGTTLPPPLAVAGLTALEHQPGMLEPGTTYYWQVTARDGAGSAAGPLWSFTVGETVSTAPEPRFEVTALSSGTFSLGHSVELLISVSNQGAAAAGAGISVSFPDLDGGDDAAVIANAGSSTGDAPGLRITPRGGPLTDAACGDMTASHLQLEYVDSNWYAGELNTLRVRVTPRRVGAFRVRVGSALSLISEPCTATTALPDGGSDAVDQRGRACREFVLDVREPEPEPVFRAVSASAAVVALGESFDLRLSVVNAGDPSALGGIMVAFPDLTDPDDASRLDNFGSSTGDSPGLMLHDPGQTLLTPDCSPLPAAGVVAEYWDTNWTTGERNDLILRITPRDVGTFTCLVRSVMQRPLAACDPVIVTPDAGAAATDFLGFPCRAVTITVREPEPQPVFDVVARSADSITLGQSFELQLAVTNLGDASDDGVISVGFPDLTEPARVVNAGSSTGDAPGLAILPPGSSILDAACDPMSTEAVLVDYRDDFWTRGERNDLRLRITPDSIGTFTYTVSCAMKRPLDACGYEVIPPADGTEGRDDRGRACRVFTVMVTAP